MYPRVVAEVQARSRATSSQRSSITSSSLCSNQTAFLQCWIRSDAMRLMTPVTTAVMQRDHETEMPRIMALVATEQMSARAPNPLMLMPFTKLCRLMNY